MALALVSPDDMGGLALPGVFVSDAEGVVEIDDLEPGRYRVEVDRGPRAELVVDGHSRGQLAIELDAGSNVEGVVVDEWGHPLSNAAIWLSWPGAPMRGWDAATSGQDGRFSLRGLAGGNWISARWSNRGVAPLRRVGDLASGASSELKLRVPEAAAVLLGTVRDPAGRTVEGARVSAATRGDLQPFRGLDGAVRLETPVLPVRSGPDGTFALPWDGPGTVRVEADGWAPWAIRLGGGEAVPVAIDARLEPGVELAGAVHGIDGQAVDGAMVEVWDRASLTARRTHTDGFGNYRIRHVASGSVDVVAVKGEYSASVNGLDLSSGAVHTWSPTMVECDTIKGQVQDAGGEPLPGWTVELQDLGYWRPRGWTGDVESASYRRTTAGDDGRFEFHGCPTQVHALRLFPPPSEPGASRPVAAVEQVRPSKQRVTLRLAPERLARFSCGVGQPGGTPPRGAELVLTSSHLRSDRVEPICAVTGRVSVDGLLPGTYAACVRTVEGALRPLSEIELAPGESRELGLVTLSELGTLVVSVEDEAGRPALDYRIELQGPRGLRVRMGYGEARERVAYPAPGHVRLDGLEPGRTYRVQVETDGGGRAAKTGIDVGAGCTRTVQLRLGRGEVER